VKSLNRNEFVNELDRILGRIYDYIEENHELSISADYSGELNHYTFYFPSKGEYNPEIASLFIRRLRKYSLEAYDILSNEGSNEDLDPIRIIVGVLQLVAKRIARPVSKG